MDDQNTKNSPDPMEQTLLALAKEMDSGIAADISEDISIEDIIAEFHEDAPSELSEATLPVPEISKDIAEPESAHPETPAEPLEEESPAEPIPESSVDNQDTRPAIPKITEEIEEEAIPSGPIVFKPRYRGSEMRKQIVNGPERRYYELQELGLGKLQFAILICILACGLSGFTTALYHFGVNVDSHLRLYIFSQVFSIFLAVIFGCYLIMDGIADMFRGRFSLNTLLAFTLLVCAADCIICLKRMWLPYGSVLCLEMTLALWGSYNKRVTEMGQTDTLRKANLLDALVRVPNYSEGKDGLLRRDGLISDYTDAYAKPSAPENIQSVYGILTLACSMAIAGLAYFRLGGDYAVHIMAGAMLCGLPASFFLTLPRPASILEQRLHKLGALLCGWKGVLGLCKKAVYPLTDSELFPAGSLTLNGVKFYGEIAPNRIISYAAALAEAQNSQWFSILRQLLESRNAESFHTDEFMFYDNGGVGGIINGDTVLMGTKAFMKDMKVDIPSGNHVDHPIYVSIDGEICAVFALSYHADKLSASGLSALTGCRNVSGIYVGSDTLVDGDFLYALFRIKPKRLQFPPISTRLELADTVIPEDSTALMLTIRNHLAARSYCISGAKALRSSTIAGMILHILGGILGLLAAAAIAYLGNTELLTAGSVLLYNLLWLIPGFVITEWTRFL